MALKAAALYCLTPALGELPRFFCADETRVPQATCRPPLPGLPLRRWNRPPLNYNSHHRLQIEGIRT